MKKAAALLLILSTPAWSQEPTVVFGASQTAPGVYDGTILTQPENAPNPLGNPIVAPQPVDHQSDTPPQTDSISAAGQLAQSGDPQQPNVINQTAPQDPAPFSVSPSVQQNQIENTLYQGGNRIYDVQSYPLNDIKTITKPNIDPTITTYPEY